MTVEFYGEISEFTLKCTDKLKKRYFANALFLLTVVLLIASIAAISFKQAFVSLLICTAIVGAVAMFLYAVPMKKKIKNHIKARIVIDGDWIVWTQLVDGKEKQCKKRVSEIKKVWRTKYCYYLIYNDISNAIICESQLMRCGSFEYLESLFPGKVINKTLN